MDPEKLEARRAVAVERIKAVAREQLALSGADALSLREVARQMGQSSSALYRYFPTRDELLTALIIDAYDHLGLSVEQAEAEVDREEFARRFLVACRAVRTWALANPHLYALLYGSPVPGYQAPERTVGPATRVSFVLARIADDAAAAAGSVGEAPVDKGPFADFLEWEPLAAVMPHVPREGMVRAILAWSNLFGYLTFELFGHFVRSVADLDATFEWMVADSVRTLGLLRPED